jgi:hypothetical protein
MRRAVATGGGQAIKDDLTGHAVMVVEQIAPMTVAGAGSAGCRSHDVGGEDRRQHSIGSRYRS